MSNLRVTQLDSMRRSKRPAAAAPSDVYTKNGLLAPRNVPKVHLPRQEDKVIFITNLKGRDCCRVSH